MSPLQTTLPSPGSLSTPGTPDLPPPEAITHLHDDVFSTSPSPHPCPLDSAASTTTLCEANPDLTKLRRVHQNEGYLAGISESKSAFVQLGFDGGYELGGRLGLVAGWVRGVAEGLVYAVGVSGPCLSGSWVGAGAGAVGGSREMEGDDDERGVEGSGGRGVGLIREVRALAKEVEREVVPEKIFCQEYFLENGVPRWRVGRWKASEGVEVGKGRVVEEEEEETGEVLLLEEIEGVEHHSLDLDLVAQSHPVLRKWVSRVTLLANKLGLDINTSESAAVSTGSSPARRDDRTKIGEGEKAITGRLASPTRRS